MTLRLILKISVAWRLSRESTDRGIGSLKDHLRHLAELRRIICFHAPAREGLLLSAPSPQEHDGHFRQSHLALLLSVPKGKNLIRRTAPIQVLLKLFFSESEMSQGVDFPR
jgi:hypothetical protein